MPEFPLLSTGAVAQYPLGAVIGQAVEVIRFLDGVDQRFAINSRPLRSWHIQLDCLKSSELESLQSFFESCNGDYSLFSFPDPYSGEVVSNCKFGDRAIATEFTAFEVGGTSFWVIETRG